MENIKKEVEQAVNLYKTGKFSESEVLSKKLINNIGGEISSQKNLTKLSIYGAGIMGRPGITSSFFQTLSDSGINIRLIATSEVKVSCVIESE